MDGVPELQLTSRQTVEPFSVWEISQTPVAFAFGAAEAQSAADAAYWRVDLPDDVTAADAHLRAVETAIRQEHAALRTVELDFDTLTATDSSVAFAASLDDPYARINARYRTLLNVAESRQYAPSGSALSFGPLDDLGEYGDALRQFHEFRQRLERSLAYYAYVETFVALERQALTTATWTSALNTFWSSDIAPDRQQQHLRSLRISTASRTALIRTSIVITAGVARIAARMAVPLGGLLTLPVIYDVIRQVGLEIQRHEEIVRQID